MSAAADPEGLGTETPSAEPAGRWPDAAWIRRLLVAVFVAITVWQLAEWMFFSIRSFILMLILAWFAAIAMEPAVEWLARRGRRRGVATGLIMLSAFLACCVFLAVFGQLLFSQLASMVQSLPTLLTDTVDWINRTFDANLDSNNILDSLNIDQAKINEWAADLAGGIFGFVTAVVSFVFNAFTVLLFTFYFSAEGPAFRRFVSSLFPPTHQPVITTVWETAIDKVGGYVLSRGVLAVISAACTSLFLLLVGVPYWLPLGIWVGLVSQFIPTIGTYLAGALPFLIALTQSAWTGLWVLAFIAGYQQLENYVLSPRISNRMMQIHPAVAFGAVIVGGSMFGPWGALVAIPAVASIQALFETYGRRFELIEARAHEHDADDVAPAES